MSRKKPVSQKRVAAVLGSLVATMTLGAGILLLLEPKPFGSPIAMAAATSDSFAASIQPKNLLQTSRWNYIIIYESGDTDTRGADLSDQPNTQGADNFTGNAPRQPVNFHFIVDRGAFGSRDGDIEVESHWLNQDYGAPSADWPEIRNHTLSYYSNAIGICLLANTNQDPFTAAQERYLLKLTSELQHELNLPPSAVRFQWELTGHPISPAQAAFARHIRAQLPQ